MLDRPIKMWELDDGETFWIAAYDRDDALSIYMKELSLNVEDLPIPMEEIQISQVDDGEVLSFRMEGEPEKESKTAFEWALDGRGIVAGSCW